MYGMENMAISGDTERSSQRAHSAFIYSLGLRTQSYPSGTRKKSSFEKPTFSTTFRMEGTTDGDINETLWDVKNFTAPSRTRRRSCHFMRYSQVFVILAHRAKTSRAEYAITDGKTNCTSSKANSRSRAPASASMIRHEILDTDEGGLAFGAHYVGTYMHTCAAATTLTAGCSDGLPEQI